MNAPQIPLFSEPLANPATQDQAEFQESAGRNFLETKTVFSGANVALAWQAGQTAQVAGHAASAGAAAGNAAISAAAAASNSTAPNWVSGTTYALNEVRRSLLNGLPYRRVVAGAGTTDPANDPTNWEVWFLSIASGLPPTRPVVLVDARARYLHPALTYTRPGATRSYFDADGAMQIAPANEPMFTHNPATREPQGLPLWKPYTNHLLHSEAFDNAAWFRPGVGTTFESGVLTEAGVGAGLRQPVTLAVGTNTVYFDLRRVNCDWVQIMLSGHTDPTLTNRAHAWFNLQTGQAGQTGAAGAGVTPVRSRIRNLGGGVYRCILIATADVSDCSAWLRSASADGSNSRADVGSGPGIGSAIAVIRSQVNNHPDDAPYVPTTTASVTTGGDSLQLTGPAFLALWQNGGTVVVEWDNTDSAGGNAQVFSVNNSSGAVTENRIGLLVEFANNRYVARCTAGAAIQASYVFGSGSVAQDVVRTAAVSVGPNYFAAASNSDGLGATASAVTMPVVDRLQIGFQAAADRLNGRIRYMAYYPNPANPAQTRALV
jgi:hypothetical protein